MATVVTDRVYFTDSWRLEQQLDRSVPRNAFHSASLDLLYGGEGFESLDNRTREQLLEFVDAFMDCGCRDAPYCGHPERKFMQYVLELRLEGLDPGDIVEAMERDYGLTAYRGDVLEFLDNVVRYLDAVEDVADTLAEQGMRREAEEFRRGLEG